MHPAGGRRWAQAAAAALNKHPGLTPPHSAAAPALCSWGCRVRCDCYTSPLPPPTPAGAPLAREREAAVQRRAADRAAAQVGGGRVDGRVEGLVLPGWQSPLAHAAPQPRPSGLLHPWAALAPPLESNLQHKLPARSGCPAPSLLLLLLLLGAEGAG
jgi:hypothetical protein